MNGVWKTVIWERKNHHGYWIPYTGAVCQLLEQHFQRNLNEVCLGDADVQLTPYIVHLNELVQISEKTGTKSKVHRVLCCPECPLARGITWQWLGDDNNWNNYSIDVINAVEDAYSKEKEAYDLSIDFPHYYYVINFGSMMQKNKRSRYHRRVRRFMQNAQVPVLATPDTDKISDDDSVIVDDAEDGAAAGTPKSSPVKTKKKTPLKDYVTGIWNSLTKNNSNDAANNSDDSGQTKKQCVSTNAVDKPSSSGASNSNNDATMTAAVNDADEKYATVDGKPWTQPWPPHTPQSKLKPVPGINPLPDITSQKKKGRKRGKSKKDIAEATAPLEIDVLKEYTEIAVLPSDESSEEQVCIICYESLAKGSSYDEDSTLVKLRICSHIFHKSCIMAMYDSGPKDNHLQCPTCKTIHGVKCGIQPPGTMVYHVLPYSLPGHKNCDTIRIIYDIHQGIQGPEHPNPGHHYSARGFPRNCYLPDNEMGRKVLRLLITAWERKLIFTIGNSATTGERDTVTWNEIHHKTEFGYSRYGHGYPDPNYFENIIAELSAQGVTESTYSWFPA